MGLQNKSTGGSGGLSQGGLKNITELDVIPDEQDLHSRFDVSEQTSASPIENSELEADLVVGSGSPTIVTDDKNGLNSVQYQSSNSDQHDANFNSSITEPLSIFWAFKWDELPSGNNRTSFCDDDSDHRFFSRNSDWRIQADSDAQTSDNSADKNWHVGSLFWTSGDAELRIDGSTLLNPSNTAKTWTGITVGSQRADQNYFASRFGEMLIYPQDKRGKQGDIESYLADKWGITI